MSTITQLTPANVTIGQQVTVVKHTDRQVFEIIKVSASGKQITLQESIQTLDKEASDLTFTPGGFAAHVSGTQVYNVESDPSSTAATPTTTTTSNQPRPGHKPGAPPPQENYHAEPRQRNPRQLRT